MSVKEVIEQLERVEDKERKILCFEASRNHKDLKLGEVCEVAFHNTETKEQCVRVYFN